MSPDQLKTQEWVGWLEKIHERLWERLDHSGYHIVRGLNFQNSVVVNNTVRFLDDDGESQINKYFWYCEIDRKQGSYDLAALKNLTGYVDVKRDPLLYERALDKHTSFSVLRSAGLPVADSILVNPRNIHTAEDIIRSWGKVVLKPRRGGYGKGVGLYSSFESIRDTVEYFGVIGTCGSEGGFHMERYYENNIAEWTSITILNGKIVYGYRKKQERFSRMGDGMYKVYNKNEIGGGVDLCHVSDFQAQIAVKAYNGARNRSSWF